MKSNLSLSIFLLLFFLQATSSHAQRYRTAEAYISDFEKNESYVIQSLTEYSSAIINDEKASRVQATLEDIYNRLGNINTIITKNGKGYLGDVSLRDAFLKMNSRTIMLLKNNTLKVTGYETEKNLSYPEIFSVFETRKSEIINYYSAIVDYTNAKRRFSKRNNLTQGRYFSKRNIFEYDAHQSLMFFKINVLDAKLCDLLSTTDDKNVIQCVSYLNQVCRESLILTDEYKNVNIDQSLNNANNDLITFLLAQNETLLPLYADYIQTLSDFNNTKEALQKNENDNVEKYNEKVRQLDMTKNKFTGSFAAIQNQKKELIDNWLKIKQNYLKKNL
ncbi:MAG: hypothetical protein H7199_07960 [Burkholderiales bacterium]|nr:hypothetical protein [Flavobacterium sp.]